MVLEPLITGRVFYQRGLIMNRAVTSFARNRPAGNGPDLPRIIVWQISGNATDPHSAAPSAAKSRADEPLNSSETMLVIDSIARTGKPIVVLTGEEILGHVQRLQDILEYGRALGLKMIVEVSPEELTDEILKAYSHFGERIFRIKIGAALGRHAETRTDTAEFFSDLESRLDRIEEFGYETHLVYTATDPDIRTLALLHDFALRRSAKGLYCHLRFDLGDRKKTRPGGSVDDFVQRFATMKEYSPSTMIISPQCVKFVHNSHRRGAPVGAREDDRPEWEYTCVAGKSYAYIDVSGNVHLCGGNPSRGVPLRDSGYDFRKIWTHAPAFTGSRKICRNCLHGYHSLSPSGNADTIPGQSGSLSTQG
jgi:MoaA/NifB/PqqE/SkfB family radical SAM enzyme